jgi:hypothetical protein
MARVAALLEPWWSAAKPAQIVDREADVAVRNAAGICRRSQRDRKGAHRAAPSSKRTEKPAISSGGIAKPSAKNRQVKDQSLTAPE